MSDQHYDMVQDLDEQRQLEHDRHTSADDASQISYWTLLDDVSVLEGTPESGDKIMLKDAGAEQTNQCLDTHEVAPLVDKPATDMDIKFNPIQIAKQSAASHTPTTRKSIATRAAKKHKYDQHRKWWKKLLWSRHHRKSLKRKEWIMSLHVTEKEVSKEATFNDLADTFTLDDKVKDLFLKGPMENLQDFRYYFAEKEEIETFVAATLGTEILNSIQWRDKCRYWQLWDQIGRVTDAWRTIRRICWANENHSADASMEANKSTDVHTLRAAELQFWKRYKTKHPMEVSPSEHLLSLCHRQIEERLLTVQDMKTVRTMAHQVAARIKKQHGRAEQAEETSNADGVERYMAKLYTYLLALGIAGSGKVQGAPEEELFGSDSTKFMGHSAGLLLSCPSPIQVSIEGITVGMAARKGHRGKCSLGLPISQRERITRRSG